MSDSLLPDRHQQHDLFICDVADAVLKDVLPQMEHPFFSLSKNPDLQIRRYEHNGQWLQVVPSVKGLATIYDKDILIYCISQIMAKIKRAEAVSRRVRINSYDLLVFANRGTAGKDYTALQEALERIRGTTISTNIKTGNLEQTDTFGLIDSSSIVRRHGLDGRLLSCEITLSDWVFNAIAHNEVLTLHRDYFRLRRPTDRRIYELARKHCGAQPEWRVSLQVLHKKSGSKAGERFFRRTVKELADGNHLPDYSVAFDADRDQILFVNRNTMPLPAATLWSGHLDSDVFEEARRVSQGWDVRVIEHEWRVWLGDNEIIPQHPERHFLRFVQSWVEKRGSA